MASTSTNKPSSSTDRDLDIDVAELLEALADEVKKDLDEDIEVIDSGTEFPSKIYTDVPKWVRVNDVVAVFGDLRNSTGPAEAQHVRGVLCGRCNRACQDFCVRSRLFSLFCWGLEVGVDAVGVGDRELGEGLLPVRDDLSLDEAA